MIRGVIAAVALLAALPATAAAQGGYSCYGDVGLPAPKASKAKLRFGIYPGGPAGVIAGPRPAAIPEVQAKIDQRVAQLRAGRTFVVHL